MVENLRLGSTTLTTNLDSTNTNINWEVTAAQFNSWNNPTTSGDAGSFTEPEFIPVFGNDTSPGGPGTPYGVLYNYCAASGNDTRACVSSMDSQLSPSYDICPAGWRLPTGGANGEFRALNGGQYGSADNMRKSVESGGAAFALAGFFGYSSIAEQGRHGYYWSSTWFDTTSMFGLELDAAYAYEYFFNRDYGWSIRCVLK